MSRKSRRNRPDPAPGAAAPHEAETGRVSRRGLVIGALVGALAIAAAVVLFSGKNTGESGTAAGGPAAALASEHAPQLGDPQDRETRGHDLAGFRVAQRDAAVARGEDARLGQERLRGRKRPARRRDARLRALDRLPAWLALDLLLDPSVPLVALVGNCCLPTYAGIHRQQLLHCFPNFVPGLNAWGDTPDIAALIAPRAFHLNFGELDGGSPIDEVRRGVDADDRSVVSEVVRVPRSRPAGDVLRRGRRGEDKKTEDRDRSFHGSLSGG